MACIKMVISFLICIHYRGSGKGEERKNDDNLFG